MNDDTVTLAAAWRARVAAGYTGPIHVHARADRHRVTLTNGERVATIGLFDATWKAHAYAEQAARDHDHAVAPAMKRPAP